ncbi:MAG TPA: toll/interleukin-1 receptor domain-containing protein [Rubrivivax sp.]|nr:toll/interleukin-1 receptor domain-containing protein [Rubrivivax sp.]
MARIFISYRRDDSGYAASIVRHHLESEFGAGSVFMDIDNIPLGVDFRTHLSDAVATCDVLIALIGERWTGAQPGSTERRIDDVKDFVRIEVEAALQRGIPVVPVLVDKAQLPAADALPASLRELVFRNAAEVRAGRDQAAQLAALGKGLHRHLGTAQTQAPPPAAQRPQIAAMEPPPDAAPAGRGFPMDQARPPAPRVVPILALAVVAAGLVAAGGWFVLTRSGDDPGPAASTEAPTTATPINPASQNEGKAAAAAAAAAAASTPAEDWISVKPIRPKAAAVKTSLDPALFDGYSIAIYYPEGDVAAGNTARSIQAELAAQGLRRGVQVRAATAEFLRSVVPPETLELRYEEGIENAQAQSLAAALAAGSGARQAKLQPVERRTANFLSLFVPAGG